MSTYTKERDGSYTVLDDSDPPRQTTIPAGLSDDEVTAAIRAFLGPDLSMPDEFPMHRLRMFLVATNQKKRVVDYLNSLPEPAKSLAKEEWEYAPMCTPKAALNRAVQAALGLNDADYAEAIRAASQHTVEDYGQPKPSFGATLAKFFFGG